MTSGLTRDEMRAKIFETRPLKAKLVDFFGVTIELRQPSLSEILKSQEVPQDASAMVIRSLVQYAYVPGTNDKMFDDTDAASFMAMPFGADFLRVSAALEELSEVNFPNTAST